MDTQLAIVDYTKIPTELSITPQQQRGWAAVGHWKNELQKRHELKALALQKLLLEPGTTITEIEATLTTYRNTHAAMVKDGQEFRKVIDDKVLQASLTIEKEYSPKLSENYLLAEKKLVDLKLAKEKDERLRQAKAQELLNYAAHVKNEFLTVSNEFRQACITEMNTMYVDYLRGQVKNPDTDAIKETIKQMKPRAYTAFPKQYMTDQNKAEYATVHNSAVAPNFDTIREEMCALLDEKFKSYSHDLKANTVEQVEQAAQQEVAELVKETQIEVGVNQMNAQANVPEVVTEGKKLKRLVEVVIEGGEQWHINVISAYLKNPLCRSYVSVKQWENLTVKQMAGCLGKYASDTGDVDQALQYREVVK